MVANQVQARSQEEGEEREGEREPRIAPGKVPLTNRTPRRHAHAIARNAVARALADLERVRAMLPALATAVDPKGARDIDAARQRASDVELFLGTARRGLAQAHKHGAPEADLTPAYAELHAVAAEAAPLLARRPPQYRDGDDMIAAHLLGDAAAEARLDADEAREEHDWHSLLDAKPVAHAPGTIDMPATFDESRATIEDRGEQADTSEAPSPKPAGARAPATIDAPPAFDESRATIDDTPVQRRASGDASTDDLHAAAASGVAGTGGALPHLDTIQHAFGPHDVTGIIAHVGGAAATASRAIGAEAYATGHHVAFAASPDLFTAAHEAAHVVQQRAGVHLLGGVGTAGDAYEQHADAVAAAVVRGESAAPLLGSIAHGSAARHVQRKTAPPAAPGDALRALPAQPVVRVGDHIAQRFDGGHGASVTLEVVNDRIRLDGAMKRGEWVGTLVGLAPGPEVIRAFVDRGDTVEEQPVAAVVRTPIIAAIDARRIHINGLAENLATTMYEGETLAVTARLADVGPDADFTGTLVADGSLSTNASTYDAKSRAVSMTAQGQRRGDIQVRAALTASDRPPSILSAPLALSVVAPSKVGDSARQIMTKDFGDAKGIVLREVELLFAAQRSAVTEVKKALLAKENTSTIALVGRLFLAAIEACFGFITAGLGTQIGKSLAGAFDEANGALFDIDSAVTGWFKDGFKAALKTITFGGDKASVSEDWAIDLFCETQANALDIASADVGTKWLNKFQEFETLEARRPGDGILALERLRHAIAAATPWAAREQLHQTIGQWMTYRANASHGTTPRPGDASQNDTEGTDLGKSGKGELQVVVVADIAEPRAPVKLLRVHSGLRREVETRYLEHGGKLLDQGIPIVVESAWFKIGRNEIGDLWIVLDQPRRGGATGIGAGGDVDEARRYLFTKGTGRSEWRDEQELEQGIQAGARRIVEEEVGGADLESLAALPKMGILGR